jgi:diacylglycerol kinase (ATP)
MKQRIQVIVNPASGRDRPVLNVLNAVFKEADVDWDVSITKEAGDATRLAAAAAEAGSDMVAVYGGDGTVTEAAAGLAGTRVPLAVLPGGTANAIAVALGIPGDLTAAARLACGSDVATLRDFDLGQIDHRHFLIAIGMGIPGELAEGADRDAKDRLGMFAYALSSLQALRNAAVVNYQLDLDGKTMQCEGVTLVVANSGNFGVPGLTLAPVIDMNDGLLDVIVFRNADLTSLVSVAASVVRKDLDAGPLQHWQAKSVKVIAEPAQAIQADGEVLEPGPISATVLPGAVRIAVPGA